MYLSTMALDATFMKLASNWGATGRVSSVLTVSGGPVRQTWYWREWTMPDSTMATRLPHAVHEFAQTNLPGSSCNILYTNESHAADNAWLLLCGHVVRARVADFNLVLSHWRQQPTTHRGPFVAFTITKILNRKWFKSDRCEWKLSMGLPHYNGATVSISFMNKGLHLSYQHTRSQIIYWHLDT